MTLRTRPPTGVAGHPNLIVEGREGAGKTHACLRLSADPRVGRTYVVEVGERRADEYAALGEFLVVEHDGTLRDITDQIQAVLALPPVDGKPTVLVVDSATALWDLCKREVDKVARSSKAARAKLLDDPDAEIESGHHAWNKVTDRYWWPWIDAARSWPGMLLLTARSEDVSKFVDGRPVKGGEKEYRVDIQKGTPFAMDGTVRMRLGKPALLTTVKSLRVPQLPAAGLEIPGDEPLAHLIFDLLGAGEVVTLSVKQAKPALVAYAHALGLPKEDAVTVASQAWDEHAGIATSFDGEAMGKLTGAVEVLVAQREAQTRLDVAS